MYDVNKELAGLIDNNTGNNASVISLESTLDMACGNIDRMLQKDAPVILALESLLAQSLANFGDDTLTFAAFESVLTSACATLDKYCSAGAFTLAAFEALINQSIENLELTPGTESMTVSEKLLEIAKATIDTKCTSLEACDEMMNTLATEAVKFNQCMANMAQAGRDLKAGTIDKAEFKQRIEPSIVELRGSCSIIGTVNEAYAAESAIPADDDIKAVREFIIGTEGLINAKRASFGATDDISLEGFINTCEEMTIATEGAATFALRTMFSEKKREAKSLIKSGKALLKQKDYTGAAEKYKKAKAIYKDLIGELGKIPETELSHVVGISEGKKTDLKSTTNMYITKAYAKEYFTRKMVACDEGIFKIENAHGKAKRKATESTDAIDSIIAEIATECVDCGCEDGDICDVDDDGDDDDDDLDEILDDITDDEDGDGEASFDSFLKD